MQAPFSPSTMFTTKNWSELISSNHINIHTTHKNKLNQGSYSNMAQNQAIEKEKKKHSEVTTNTHTFRQKEERKTTKQKSLPSESVKI